MPTGAAASTATAPGARAAVAGALLVAGLFAGGCHPADVELAFEMVAEMMAFTDGVRFTGGATTHWDLPETVEDPGTYVGGEITFTTLVGFETGLSYYGGNGGLFTTSVMMDMGKLVSFVETGGEEGSWWLVVEPEVGLWVWSEPPDGAGLLMGVTAGVALPLDGGMGEEYLRLGYTWQWLEGVDMGRDARVEKATLSWMLMF